MRGEERQMSVIGSSLGVTLESQQSGECDLFVAVTSSSFGLGFETGYLLGATTKKTLLFLSERRSTGSLS